MSRDRSRYGVGGMYMRTKPLTHAELVWESERREVVGPPRPIAKELWFICTYHNNLRLREGERCPHCVAARNGEAAAWAELARKRRVEDRGLNAARKERERHRGFSMSVGLAEALHITGWPPR